VLVREGLEVEGLEVVDVDRHVGRGCCVDGLSCSRLLGPRLTGSLVSVGWKLEPLPKVDVDVVTRRPMAALTPTDDPDPGT
jgi:hypothetical protein